MRSTDDECLVSELLESSLVAITRLSHARTHVVSWYSIISSDYITAILRPQQEVKCFLPAIYIFNCSFETLNNPQKFVKCFFRNLHLSKY